MDSDNEVKSKLKKNPITLDDFFTFGWYTTILCVMTELVVFTELANTIYMIYAGANPHIVGCGNSTQDSGFLDSGCSLLKKCQTGEVPTFDYQFYSVNLEWNHICADASAIKTSTSIQMFGVVIGSIIFGQMSDIFGRKKPLILCLSMCFVLGIATAFSQNLFQFTFCRTLIGVFNGGHTTIILVYLLEKLPNSSRMWVTSVVSWSPNMIIFGLIAYLFPHWMSLSNVIAIAHLPAIALLLFLDESPRYLIQRGDKSAAHKAIVRMRKLNGHNDENAEVLEQLLDKEVKLFAKLSKKKYTFYHIFSTKSLAIACSVISFSYLVTSLINYSLLFNMDALSGSLFVNSALTGAMRWIVNLSFGLMDTKIKWFGRKLAHTSCLVIVIAAISVATLSTANVFGDYAAITMRTSVLIACGLAAQIYLVNGIACGEIFPTSIRTLTYSFLQIFSRGGIVLAPYVFSLGSFYILLPFIFMLTIGLADGILFQTVLPESKNAVLESHITKAKTGVPTLEEEVIDFKGSTMILPM